MITPRQTRLLRVPNLSSFQHVLASLIGDQLRVDARSAAVLVPSAGAAGELRQTLETLLVAGNGPGENATTLVFPDLLTRRDWYRQLHDRLPNAPPLLDELEREVLMGAAARESDEQGLPPPFRLRPGLIAEIVRLYDELARVRKTIDQFERLVVQDLEGDADIDRGAARLLQQTHFLVRTFRQYEAKLSELCRLDEHRLRSWLINHPLQHPYTSIIVAVSDRAADPDGLWPADFDLLTRLPGLRRIDVVATERQLAAGLHERVHQVLPGIEELRLAAPTDLKPQLLVPAASSGDQLYFRSRDREDELCDIAHRLTKVHKRRTAFGRVAVVFKRPLPYVWLAREVLGSARIPYQTLDALPLAAEPYAAAIDLVFDVVAANFSRSSMVALLRCPHFTFIAAQPRPVASRAIAGWDRALKDAGYLGGLEQLRKLVDQWATSSAMQAQATSNGILEVANIALEVADRLAPLQAAAAAGDHFDRLFQFLERYDRAPLPTDPLREPHLRSRAAILSAVASLRDAHRAIDNRTVGFAEIAAAVRRWIEAQTFAPHAGSGGVHLVDAGTAPFGFFEEVHLVGLVDTDWPDRVPRNIFFPSFLLQQLGWPSDADRLVAGRAGFQDLLYLARERVSVSTFSLEDDAIVSPSVFLDDLETAGLALQHVESGQRSFSAPSAETRGFADEPPREDPMGSGPRAEIAKAWLALRQSRTDRCAATFQGMIGSYDRAPYSVSSLETYLDCPFRFFAKHVLSLDEEQDDEETRRPRTQGVFLHRVFQAFFQEWARAGHRTITLSMLPEARALFARVVGPLLDELPESERTLERNRLFGTAAAEGLAEIVFRVEAESEAEVSERLLEHRLDGEFEMRGAAGPRRVALTGVADRIDLLQDGTLRVIDYKSGRAPSTKRMLQLPVYSVCAAEQLAGRHGRSWTVGNGGYIAFRDPRRFVALGDRNEIDQVLADAQTRLVTAIDEIRAGRFPVSPLEPFRCTFCSYANVCRRDYIGDE